jgi:dihydroflavonol-4-reductase
MILVTGGTGFIGSYILQNLVARGHAVRALRRSARLPFYFSPAIAEKIDWVEGDILDPVSLYDAMQEVDSVIHSAAVVSFHARLFTHATASRCIMRISMAPATW